GRCTPRACPALMTACPYPCRPLGRPRGRWAPGGSAEEQAPPTRKRRLAAALQRAATVPPTVAAVWCAGRLVAWPVRFAGEVFVAVSAEVDLLFDIALRLDPRLLTAYGVGDALGAVHLAPLDVYLFVDDRLLLDVDPLFVDRHADLLVTGADLAFGRPCRVDLTPLDRHLLVGDRDVHRLLLDDDVLADGDLAGLIALLVGPEPLFAVAERVGVVFRGRALARRRRRSTERAFLRGAFGRRGRGLIPAARLDLVLGDVEVHLAIGHLADGRVRDVAFRGEDEPLGDDQVGATDIRNVADLVVVCVEDVPSLLD